MRQKILAGLSILILLRSVAPAPAIPAQAAGNPIVTENQQTGSGAWQLSGRMTSDDATGQIKGYASATSVNQNQTITLFISVNPPQTYTMDVYRIGWYGGLGGRQRLHAGPLQGSTQQACPTDATTGQIACTWTPSYTLTIPGDWTSGVYVALLNNAQGYQNYVIFVVRDGRPASFLYQQSVMTYEAYNNWPDDGTTGKSLYTFNSHGANTISGEARAVKVSFDRPYTWNGAGYFFFWDVDFIRWLERSGYDVTYSTDVDTHENGAALRNSRAFLSAGHDEYWSKEMFDAVAAARDAGVNLGFFGANTAGWVARLESSSYGVADRVMVCYKSSALDPVYGPTTTTEWRLPPVSRPEQTLAGVQWTAEVAWGNNVGYVVTNSSHWVYAGTGFKDGDVVPGIVGYEMDRYQPNYTPPATASWTLLSHSPFTSVEGVADYANSSIYQAPSGAWVFAAGTISWGWALDNFDHNLADSRIQQMTTNVLNAFLYGAPVVDHLQVTAPATATAGQAFSVSVAADNTNGNPVAQYSGTVHFTTSDTSSGIVLPADSSLTNGQGTFSATLDRAGAQTLTVADTANSLSATISVAVQAAPANHLALATTAAPTATAGASFAFTVTAQDSFGNTDLAYSGAVHFSSTDASPGVVLPSDSTLTSGSARFSAALDHAGWQTITGSDTATPRIAGSVTVQVTAAQAASAWLGVPGSVKADHAFGVTVTLEDRFGNVATGYTGTVHFTTSDLTAQTLGKMPGDYQFSARDAGSHTFSVTLMTPTSQTITVTDTGDANLRATSPPIWVSLL